MSVGKQAILAALVCLGAVVVWALYVPAARPFLDRAGLTQPLQSIGVLAPTDAAAAPQGGGSGGAPPVQVIATEATPQVMADVVTAIGSARGVRSVVVAAEVSGQLVTLSAAPGQFVTAGTVLAELDSATARIAMDRAALILRDARATSDRVARLQGSGAATDLQVSEADLALKTAELNLRDAELVLQRHSIKAPIDGWVGILPIEPGDRVAPGEEVARIEDRSSLIVDFRVPERLVSRLTPGMPVEARALADPGRALAGTISALDNRVDVASRSLAVQAAIPNADDALRAGMAFSISLAFSGPAQPAVDPLAIQWGADGAFVWALREGKALRLPVRILQRNSDAVLIEAELAPGDLVVTEGVQALRPGLAAEAVSRTATADAPKS